MTIRFYDHDEVTYTQHFAARDPNKEVKEKEHNGRIYRKLGTTQEARSILWSIGQVFKGISCGVIAAMTLPLSLCCRPSNSHSCFKAFLKSIEQAWRREETVNVYVLRAFGRQPFFQESPVPESASRRDNPRPLTNPLLPQSPRPVQETLPDSPIPTTLPLSFSADEQNVEAVMEIDNPRPLTSPLLPQSPRPVQETLPDSPIPITSPFSFSPDEQNIEAVMEAVEKRFEHGKDEWEKKGNRKEANDFLRETFDLVEEWIEHAPANFERSLAYARLIDDWDMPQKAYEIYSAIVERNPDNLAIRKEAINFLGKRAFIKDLLSHLEAFLALEPNDSDMRFHYGELLYKEYEIEKAAEQCKQLLASNADDVAALFLHARCLGRMDAPLQACSELEKAIALAPENSALRFEYATILEQQDSPEAKEQYEKALELAPLNVDIRDSYLHLLRGLNLSAEIIRVCEEGFQLPIDSGNFEEIYCTALNEQGEVEKLRRYCQQHLNEEPGACAIRTIYAQVLLEQDEEEEAAQQFSMILEHEPNNMGALSAYYELLMSLGEGGKIGLYHQKRVEDGVNSIDGQLVYACSLISLEEFEAAEAQLRDLLGKISPNSYQRRSIENQYFEVLKDLGRSEIIEQCIQSIIQQNPNDFKGHEQLADFWNEQQRVDKACEVLEAFLARFPDSLGARRKLMELLEQAGEFEKLRECYEMHLNLAPSDVYLRRKYGDLLARLNRHEEAAEQYRQALECNFSDYYLMTYVALLKRINKAGEIPLFYEKALGQNVNNHEMRSSYAKYLAGEGKFAEAAEQYEMLLETGKGSAIRVEFARVLIELNRQEEAVEQYKQVLNSTPARFYSYDEYFKLLNDLNRIEEVEIGYSILIESKQEHVRESYALWLKGQNRLAEAAEQFREVLKSDPLYFNHKPYLEVLEALNQFDEIDQFFQQKIQNSEEPLDARMNYANYLREHNRFDEEEVQLKLCVEADLKSYYARGQYVDLLRERGKIDQIDRFYLEAIEKSKESDENFKFELLYDYIKFLSQEGKPEEAARWCLRVAESHPMTEWVWNLMCDLFAELGRLPDLDGYYRKALNKNSGNLAARLGYIHYLRLEKRKGEAELQCKESLRIDPSAVSVRKSYVDFLSREGRYADAIQQCEEGLKQDPNSRAGALENLRPDYASVLVEAGFKDKAAEQYRILIDQGYSYYQWNLDRLEK